MAYRFLEDSMDYKPTLSVAMATFNGAPYLEEQLSSLAKQTYLPCELVVTDDGSTDSTEAIIHQFAQTAPFPVRWHRNSRRLGYRSNFMRAADLCTGELIAFCDQDDVWYANKLSAAVMAFEEADVLLFHHEAITKRNDEVIAEKLNKLRSDASRVGALASAPWQFPLGFTIVFRASLREYKDLWPNSLDFRTRGAVMSHDQWYWFLASSLGSVVFHSEPLADYRQHDSNTYGIGVFRRGLLARFQFVFENRIDVYRYVSAIAFRQSQILRRAESGEKRRSGEIGVASRAWDLLGSCYKARADLYDGRLLERVSALMRLLKAGVYNASGTWSFGRKSLIKDLGLGVFFGPVVKKMARPGSGGDWACHGTGTTNRLFLDLLEGPSINRAESAGREPVSGKLRRQ